MACGRYFHEENFIIETVRCFKCTGKGIEKATKHFDYHENQQNLQHGLP